MGARGPAPKNPERRQRRRAGAAPVVRLSDLPPSPVGTPDPPKGLSKRSREAWEAFWASSQAKLVAESALPALERLFLLRDDLDAARRAFRSDPLVKGSMGQARLNPLGEFVLKLEREIRELEDRFGLSPRSQLALGAQFGDTVRSLEELNRPFRERDDDDSDPRLAEIQQPDQDR